MLCYAVLYCAMLCCRPTAGAAELAVLFNRLATVCVARQMNVKGLNTAKVGDKRVTGWQEVAGSGVGCKLQAGCAVPNGEVVAEALAHAAAALGGDIRV